MSRLTQCEKVKRERRIEDWGSMSWSMQCEKVKCLRFLVWLMILLNSYTLNFEYKINSDDSQMLDSGSYQQFKCSFWQNYHLHREYISHPYCLILARREMHATYSVCCKKQGTADATQETKTGSGAKTRHKILKVFDAHEEHLRHMSSIWTHPQTTITDQFQKSLNIFRLKKRGS